MFGTTPQYSMEARQAFNNTIANILYNKYGNQLSNQLLNYLNANEGEPIFLNFYNFAIRNRINSPSVEAINSWLSYNENVLCDELVRVRVMAMPMNGGYGNQGYPSFAPNGLATTSPQSSFNAPSLQQPQYTGGGNQFNAPINSNINNTGLRYIPKNGVAADTAPQAPIQEQPVQQPIANTTQQISSMMGNNKPKVVNVQVDGEDVQIVDDVAIRDGHAVVNPLKTSYSQTIDKPYFLDVSEESSQLITSVSRYTAVVGAFDAIDTREIKINTPLNTDKEAIELVASRINIFNNQEYCCKISYPKLMWYRNYRHKTKTDIDGTLRAQDEFRSHVQPNKDLSEYTAIIHSAIVPRGKAVVDTLIKDVILAKINALSRLFLFPSIGPDMYLRMWEWKHLNNYNFQDASEYPVICNLAKSKSYAGSSEPVKEVIWKIISGIVTDAIAQTVSDGYGIVDFEDPANETIMLSCPYDTTFITYDHDEMTKRFLIRDYKKLNDSEKMVMRKAFAKNNLCCITRKDIILTNGDANKFIKHAKCTLMPSTTHAITTVVKSLISSEDGKRAYTSLVFTDKNNSIIPYPAIIIGKDTFGTLKISPENPNNDLVTGTGELNQGNSKEFMCEADGYIPLDDEEYTVQVVNYTDPNNVDI